MRRVAAFDVTPLGGPDVPGVLVTGLTRKRLDDAETQAALRALWIDKGVILFRDLAGEDTHLALSRIFGTLTAHPTGVSHNDRHPELSDIHHRPSDANVVQVGGKSLGAFLPWHKDLIYFAEINRGGILRAIEPAASGGGTGFIDQIAAYDRLPVDLRERIEGLSVVYWGDFRLENSRYGDIEQVVSRSAMAERIIAKRDQFPRVAHPMVYRQPDTGRRVLNVSPWFAQEIEGMATPEGFALLDRLVAHCCDKRYAYVHRWEKDDMILWDNWRALHRACGVDPAQTRLMQRTTILGDYGEGRVVRDTPQAASLERVSIWRSTMAPRNLSHIAIGVRDMEASLGFYRDIIGLTVSVDQVEDFREPGLTTHRRGVYLRWAEGDDEAFIVLDQTLGEGGDSSAPKKPFEIGVHHFGFWVDDVDPILDRARAAGHAIILDPIAGDSGGYGEPAGRPIRACLLKDPDGNFVQLDQRVDRG